MLRKELMSICKYDDGVLYFENGNNTRGKNRIRCGAITEQYLVKKLVYMYHNPSVKDYYDMPTIYCINGDKMNLRIENLSMKKKAKATKGLVQLDDLVYYNKQNKKIEIIIDGKTFGSYSDKTLDEIFFARDMLK